MFYVLSFSVGVMIGFIASGFMIGASTINKEYDSFMEGYLQGKSEHDSEVLKDSDDRK